MKRLIFIGLMAYSVMPASATPYYDNITNLWFQGRHSNVLAIAKHRLAVNTNDIAGVLIQASWDFEFSNATVLSNALQRVVAVGATCHTPSFTNEYAITLMDVNCTLDGLSLETPEQIAEDAPKRGLPGKQMHFMEDLKALDDDGFFIGEAVPGGARGKSQW